MRLFVNHTTTYQYNAPIDYGLQQVRLTPKERAGQNIIAWDLTVEGGKKETSFTDQHENHVDLISIDGGGDKITIHCKGEVEISETSGVIGQHKGYMPLWGFRQNTMLTQAGPNVELIIKELSDNGAKNADDIIMAHDLSALIVKHVPYEIGKTNADTGSEEALSIGAGVCQDHAHIFITAMRAMGYPARYVSGYLMMNDRVNQDATHAWAEAYFDAIGWVGFDVSNGYSPDERYIRVATGLDYRDASPISGMRYGASSENMVVKLQVQQ